MRKFHQLMTVIAFCVIIWILCPRYIYAEQIVPENEKLESQTTILYKGQDGDLVWSIDSTGHLMIEGEGNSSFDKAKWLEHSTEILSAEVNVKYIVSTESMFQGCQNMEWVDLSGLDTSRLDIV